MKPIIASASTILFLLTLAVAPAMAEGTTPPPAPAPKAVPKTPQEKCMTHSATVFEACKAECAKDLDQQVRCSNRCSQKNDAREKECKKPS